MVKWTSYVAAVVQVVEELAPLVERLGMMVPVGPEAKKSA